MITGAGMERHIEMLFDKKRRAIPITMLTAYDFPTAQLEDQAGVDSILVGDSVGTNMLGYASEQEVTMADMVHHVAAVKRGTKRAYLVADLPFGSVNEPSEAFENSSRLLEAGAVCVKLEGWSEKVGVISYLTKKGVEVCAHIGYNPQIHGPKPRMFGKDATQAMDLIKSAIALENAGAVLLVIEKVPEEISEIISKKLTIPVIGIGSGRKCDGQVLVVNDILGITPMALKHARKYMDYRTLADEAIRSYVNDVERHVFPSDENSRHIDPVELGDVISRGHF
jgi:3-methyl-2-oxobutanoate hydroxymethyltransferase